jgi:glucokinase
MVASPNQSSSFVGIEISANGLIAAVIDDSFEIKASRSIAVVDPQNTVAELITLVKEIERDFPISTVGIALPGLIERKSGRVEFSTNPPGHAGRDLVSEITAETGLDVVVENDANAAAYGEFCCGAGRGGRNMFYATLGVGVGGAFIFDGRIWRGASGFAGEFGYVTINSEGTRLEDVASAANITRRTQTRVNRDSTSSLENLAEQGITLDEIVNAAGGGDDFAAMMLERTGNYVGIGLATVINLLNIEKIVIGGEIMQAKHLVLDAIIERTRELSFKPSFDSTEIVEGELGSKAAAIGVAVISGEAK